MRYWEKGIALGMAACAMARAEPLDLSLQSLMELDVTSVSKRSQKMGEVATSIYVITEEDIARSGATRLQDALKMAPGAWFHDVSYGFSAYAVRNNAGIFSSTLLWILDGVPITNPVTGGIVFNVFDLPLSNIARIEVIKGPGGTIYGANAATGIISIFTRDAEESQGGHAVLEGGTQGFVAPFIQMGFEPVKGLSITGWMKFKSHDGYDRNPLFAKDSAWVPVPGGAEIRSKNRFSGSDDGQIGLTGGTNWVYRPSEKWKWSASYLQGAVENGQYSLLRFPYPDSAPTAGGPLKRPDSIFQNTDRLNQVLISGRVDRDFRQGHSLFLNAYHWGYDFKTAMSSGFRLGFSVSNLEVQDNLEFGRHNMSVGANVRRIHFDFGDLRPDGSAFFANPDRTDYLLGAFLQDELSLGEKWRLTFGSKAETWTLIGKVPEISPSLRLAFLQAPDRMYWGAASRSVTTPSYAAADMEIHVDQVPPAWMLGNLGFPVAPPAAGKWVALVPGYGTKPEEFYTVEAGHRFMGEKVQWDVSAYYSWLKNQTALTAFDSTLQTTAPSRARPGDTVVPLYNANMMEREVFGGEGVVHWLPAAFARLELSYSLHYSWRVRGLPLAGDTTGKRFRPEGRGGAPATPRHVGRAKCDLDLPWNAGITAYGAVSSPFSRGSPFNYVTQTADKSGGVIVDPARTQFHLDLSAQKKMLRDRLTLSLWGRNLLEGPFVESFNQYAWTSYPHQVHRTFGAGLDFRF